MKTLREMLWKEQKNLMDLLAKSNKNIAKHKALPQQHIQIATRNGHEQYYLYDASSKTKSYVKHEDMKNYSKLMQRDYELSVNRVLKRKTKLMEKMLNIYSKIESDDIEMLHTKMPSLKRKYVVPILVSEEDYIADWLEKHPGQQNTFPEEGLYKTNRSEMVRSKSEKIIADTLDKYNIPYQYEPLLELGYNTVYPDFIVLNTRTRRTIYWEHLGIVSDMEYAVKNFKKLQTYEKNGYLLGRDLVTTMESSDLPIDVKLVEEKIKEFLL